MFTHTLGYYASSGTFLFTPAELSSLTFWLDADALTGYSDTDPVDTWDDLGPNGWDVTAAGTARPTYVASGLNGRATLAFDDTQSQGFSRASVVISDLAGATTGTAYVVSKIDSGSSTANVQLFIIGGGTDSYLLGHVEATSDLVYDHGAVASRLTLSQPGSYTGNWKYHEYYRAGTGSNEKEISVDGTLVGSGTDATNIAFNTDTLYIGRTSATFLKGQMAEVIVCDTALSSMDRSNVETYLKLKWGL